MSDMSDQQNITTMDVDDRTSRQRGRRAIAQDDIYDNGGPRGARRLVARKGQVIPIWYRAPEQLAAPAAAPEPHVPEPETPEPETPEPETPEPAVDYDQQSPDDLQAEVERRRAEGREIEVTGTGRGGKVVKADLVTALKADDEAAAQ